MAIMAPMTHYVRPVHLHFQYICVARCGDKPLGELGVLLAGRAIGQGIAVRLASLLKSVGGASRIREGARPRAPRERATT
jgi:hypothetical protein